MRGPFGGTRLETTEGTLRLESPRVQLHSNTRVLLMVITPMAISFPLVPSAANLSRSATAIRPSARQRGHEKTVLGVGRSDRGSPVS